MNSCRVFVRTDIFLREKVTLNKMTFVLLTVYTAASTVPFLCVVNQNVTINPKMTIKT